VKRLGPAATALVAALALFLSLRQLVVRMIGPPGFDVVVSARGGTELSRTRVSELITPEVAPTPPPGGALVARTTFLARTDGVYLWQLGGTSQVTMTVDGTWTHAPRPGRVAGKEQTLTAGLHAIEVRMPLADDAGGIALAVKPPDREWGAPLLGPGNAVAAPVAAVQARLGPHAIAIVRALDFVPAALTLVAIAVVALAIGRTRRRRVVEYARALAADPLAQRAGVVLAIIAILWPMLAPMFAPGFYACAEEESYIVRLAEYKLSLLGGVPMGRWWPDPVFGRGYPFLCLYAPLLYIVATPPLVLGLSSLHTVKLISIALVAVGAVATYRTARRRASTPASLVAVVLFTYAPYLHTNLWVRQDLAESLGFACFPLAIHFLDRALDGDAGRAELDIAWLALSLFCVGSCHNITAYFSVYFLVLWLVMRLLLGTVGRVGLRRAIAGAALGFLLTVGYAVPAIGDAQRVWMVRVMTGYYWPFGHFIPLGKLLFAPPKWGHQWYVGIPGTLALIAGIVAVVARRPRGQSLRQPNARLLALLSASGVVLALALASKPIGWPVVKYVPLANYVQFPWRMFTFAGCLAPLCAPAAVDGFFGSQRARWIVAAVAGIVVIGFLVPEFGPAAPLVRSRLHPQEYLRSLEVDYVTSMNEYLPKTVKRTVRPFGEVAHVVAGNAALLSPSRTPGRYDATTDGTSVSLVEFNAHWFPGWRVTVDGAELRVGPGTPDFDDGGLIRVRVPPGRHAIALRYGRTPLRAACDTISLLALFAVGALVLAFAMLRSRRAAQG
jgi:hypothetical protein